MVTSVPEFWQFVACKGSLHTSQGKGHSQYFSFENDEPCSSLIEEIPLLTSCIVALSICVLTFPHFGGNLGISQSVQIGIFFTY